MKLYLREELVKSDTPAPSKAGEQRGGSYVARAQIGAEADGSPKYRYFKTQEEYDEYLGHKKSAGKKLEEKVDKEHKESTEKQRHPNLLSPKDAEKTEKSIRLYVRG